jgi:CheY-like chemotaxis protein
MIPLKCPAIEGIRVLVVDDDEDGRDLLATVLARNGALVTTAGTAAEALDLFERERPRVLISDIALPLEDGFSLLQKIRALDVEHAREVAAVALSGYGSEADRARARDAGFQAHLTKPIGPELLLQTLTELLARG